MTLISLVFEDRICFRSEEKIQERHSQRGQECSATREPIAKKNLNVLSSPGALVRQHSPPRETITFNN